MTKLGSRWFVALGSLWMGVAGSADIESKPVSDPDTAHGALFIADRYPSATECGGCHPRHYSEWSVSQHAYAQMSPVAHIVISAGMIFGRVEILALLAIFNAVFWRN